MTSNGSSHIVAKVWNYCNILRDDGVGYGDYPEQLTYMLFLKMADEYSRPTYNRQISIPSEFNWESHVSRTGAKLEVHFVDTLRELGSRKGILGLIFFKAQNKNQAPAKPYKLVHLINEETWISIDYDVKSEIYEGLLKKNAQAWTKELWLYDLRTNQHFTLKPSQMQFEDLQDLINCCNLDNRFRRKETERFKHFTYEELAA